MSAMLQNYRRKLRVGAVRELPTGEVAISKIQRNVHVTFEALAVFVAAPACFYIAATNKGLPDWQRAFLTALGATTLIVDGGLLISYMNKKKNGAA